MKQLSDIDSFGGIDADADDLLRACFTDHTAYLDVMAQRRFLVLGRKGSGKTAIYKQLITSRARDSFSFGYTFDDYPWAHHDLQAEISVPEERRYVHSWKYLMLMGLSKILLNFDSSQPWSDDSQDALSGIEDFVVDSYGARDPDLSKLFSPDKELRLKGSFGFKGIGVTAERVRVKELPVHIQEVNQAVQAAVLTALNPLFKYFICFDELDLGFSLTEDKPRYRQRLIGLLIAAKDLFVAARNSGKQFAPVIFLRDDIYQDLSFEDKNKITENYATSIVWDGPGGLTLRQLMERRFTELLSDTSIQSVSWDDVFDEDADHRMPGRQTKYQHISDRTMLRPRDMIKFCNSILAEYKISDARGAFDNAAIHSARESYSDYLLNEIDDEVSKHVPMYKEYLEVIKAVGSEKFEFDDFASTFDQREELAGLSAQQALADLFAFSIISYLRPGGRGGGSEYVWRYKDPRARFDSTVTSYRVHPGFKEALGLIR